MPSKEMVINDAGFVEDYIEKIVMDDDPILRKVSLPVTCFDEQLKDLVRRMIVTMRSRKGRGISAVQIGHLKRVIIAVVDDHMWIMVNPVLVRSLNRFTIEQEGCLSIPAFKWREVSRPAKCEIKWQGVMGGHFQENFAGDAARVLQHEMDHLEGILITDKPLVR